MSMYSAYLRERTNDMIVETKEGFGTYRYLDENTVYVVDLFVLRDFRRLKAASNIADIIVAKAKEDGCIKALGSVVPSTRGSTEALKWMLAYGMKLESSTNDFVVFSKEI